MSKHIVPILVGALIVAGGAFYGGTIYAKGKSPSGAATFQNRMVGANGQRGGFAGRGGAGFVNGEVLSKDAISLTVKMPDGSSKIVFFASSTNVAKLSQGTLDDVTQGVNVTVTGTPNADGSETAQMIQIRPSGMDLGAFGRGGNAPAGSPTPTPANQ